MHLAVKAYRGHGVNAQCMHCLYSQEEDTLVTIDRRLCVPLIALDMLKRNEESNHFLEPITAYS
jgi:hypothetical protein